MSCTKKNQFNVSFDLSAERIESLSELRRREKIKHYTTGDYIVNVIDMEVSSNDCGNKIQLLKKLKIFQDVR